MITLKGASNMCTCTVAFTQQISIAEVHSFLLLMGGQFKDPVEFEILS